MFLYVHQGSQLPTKFVRNRRCDRKGSIKNRVVYEIQYSDGGAVCRGVEE